MQFFTNKSWMYSLTQGQFTPLLASLPSITFDGHRPCDPIPIIGPGLQQNMIQRDEASKEDQVDCLQDQ
ncbi:hypothetical protein EYC84_001733 [Monilinia fructicola]|uniref:Uncharacterized protein n=1 Tax=Monilinia fructicola TaxID=38448 RepID=A0A5M9JT15_MONFR|nr:hypothetical protein EYC84_001733 [Monilinia fructicola]